jgi:hypothetical protein
MSVDVAVHALTIAEESPRMPRTLGLKVPLFWAMATATLASAAPAAADDDGPLPRPIVISASSPRSRVHLEADRPARLESLDPISFQWNPVCDAPCDRELPVELQYRIAGRDIRPSEAIQLAAMPGRAIALRANTASTGPHLTGQTMVVAGALTGGLGGVLVIGGFFAALSAGGIDGSSDHSSSATAAGDVAITGFIVLGAGALVALTGGVVWLANWQPTTVEQVVGRPRASLPRWRVAGPELPKVTGAPIFSVAF